VARGGAPRPNRYGGERDLRGDPELVSADVEHAGQRIQRETMPVIRNSRAPGSSVPMIAFTLALRTPARLGGSPDGQ